MKAWSIFVPGVFYADKVIVQSEDMRQIYINVLSRYTGEQNRSHWEETILGIGSPKFDKVDEAEKESIAVPADWLRIIRKPDGSWKKVVFYNTGISSLLEQNFQMLAQMEDAFEFFFESKSEIAFIWRPHPLTVLVL